MGDSDRKVGDGGDEEPYAQAPYAQSINAQGFGQEVTPPEGFSERYFGCADRLQLHIAAVVFVWIFSVYVRTCNPSIAGGDAGEVMAASYLGGAIHPPGFPLYNVIAFIFGHYMPYGKDAAHRINLASAVMGAASSVFMYLTVVSRSSLPCDSEAGRHARTLAGVMAAGLYAFAPLPWRYHTHGEVFSLNNLIACVSLFLLRRYLATRSRRVAYLGAFVIGLGVSSNYVLVFMHIPLVACVLIGGVGTNLHSIRSYFALVLAGLAGLLPYAQIVYAGNRAYPPAITWGDGSTVYGFFKHVLRWEYGTFHLSAHHSHQASLIDNLSIFFDGFIRGQSLFGLAAVLGVTGALLGVLSPRKHSYELCVVIICTFNLVVFQSMANITVSEEGTMGLMVVQRFWLQPIIMIMSLAGSGTGWLLERALATNRGSVATWLAAFLVLASVGAQLGINMHHCNESDNYHMVRYGRDLLDGLPRNALLLVMNDEVVNPVRWARYIENRRRDVVILDQNIMSAEWHVKMSWDVTPGVFFPRDLYWPSRADGYNMLEFLEHNIERFDVFTIPFLKDDSWKVKYSTLTWGLWLRVIETSKLPSIIGEWKRAAQKLLEAEPDIPGEKYSAGSWELAGVRRYWFAYYTMCTEMLQVAIQKSGGRDMTNRSLLLTAVQLGMRAEEFTKQVEDRGRAPMRDTDMASLFLNTGTGFYYLSTVKEDCATYLPLMKVYYRKYLDTLRRIPDSDPTKPKRDEAAASLVDAECQAIPQLDG